jgi:predicted DNA-binding transcriptional regulator YafY
LSFLINKFDALQQQYIMNDDSLKKFNRTVAILTQLQAKRIVKAQELADRFGVSLRTIYRDIKTLESSGVPIMSEAGVGYMIMEGYRLPPVMFTREEASSLLTAEKLMQKFTDKSIGSFYETAMIKIKSVLRSADKDWIDVLENQIAIHPAQQLFNKNIPDALEIVLESIAEKRQLLLSYKSLSDEITERVIEPVGVFHEYNFWYMLGYCLLRNDYRQFRTDRMYAIKRTPHKFSKQHGKLADYRKDFNDYPKVKVRFIIDKKIAKHIANTKKHYGFVSELETEEGIEMTFMTSEIEQGFPRWILMFGDYASIIEPEELKENVKSLLKRINDKMRM